ncbi:MAG TPA: ATP-binding protein [Candidatus Sulfotelmatobacter sp.]|nr:ATP-binding protein [Candidatus Sulfotelmatobacter sp.]
MAPTKVMTSTRSTSHDQRVLVLAPRGRDADLISSALEDVGVLSHICRGAKEVVEELKSGASAAVIAEEALGEKQIEDIAAAISNQPPWSDLPIIVLTGGGEPNRATRQLASMRIPLGNLTLQERPLRAVTLVSSVQAALRAREKQYEVRDHLRELQFREEALRRAEEQFRQLANAMPQLAWIADSQGRTLWYNDGWFTYTGKTFEQLDGSGWQSLHDPEILPQILQRWHDCIRKGMPFEMEFPLRGADGHFRWFLTRVIPIRDKQGKINRWLGTNTDIHARREAREVLRSNQERLEAEVAKRTAALRQLSSRLIRAQDEERRRLARELHDSMGQYLAAMSMSLAALVADTPSIDKKRSDDLQNIIQLCLSETRTLSHLLHPPLLDEIGLASAMKWFVEEFGNRSGIRVTLHCECSQRLPTLVETMLFRVVQEALTNIHKHSGSPTAEVSLRGNSADVVLEVSDQGRGMPRELFDRLGNRGCVAGVGLAGMRERVFEIGGDFRLQSDPQGTSIRVSIPVAIAA